MELGELIARLEKATEPSRELFEAAYVACRGDVDWGNPDSFQPFRKFLAFIEIEAWTDAALTLVPEGWTWWVQTYDDGRAEAAVLGMRVERHSFDGAAWSGPTQQETAYTKSPAIALCIAALKARQSLQSSKSKD